MAQDIPLLTTLIFLVLCIVVFYFFLKMLIKPFNGHESKKNKFITSISISIWLAIQALLSQNGFYLDSYEMPPRALIAVGPPMLTIFILLYVLWRSEYVKKLSLNALTQIHVFRFPLEFFVLTGLASSGYIPDVMTYEGRNYDIVVGLTAPIIGYLYFYKKSISWKILLTWHIISLGFLLFITTHALLSLPYSFQVFGMDQPNIGVFYFPFIWLPTLLVGVGYFCHIFAIHKLMIWRDKA